MTARKKSSSRRGGRGKRKSPYSAKQEHETSLPTSRNAYIDTREWLLARHGPHCAYCGRKVAKTTITLDHVAPRRGQTAYDRRDNLVLCCKSCNTAKADSPILKFLLANKDRARNMVRYGKHLSPLLVKMARDMAGPGPLTSNPFGRGDDSPYND